MSAAVVTVAQQKGGCGKTTMVAQLAVTLAQEGLRVVCVDIDPQGTLASWGDLREQAARRWPVAIEVAQGWKLKLTIDQLVRAHDVVVVDSPPHADTESRTAIRAASLVLVPCQPSLLDVWASGATLELAAREERPAAVVWNRVPPRGRIIDEAVTALADRGHASLPMGLGNRSAYAQSMHRGAAVVETEPRGRAAAEMQALAEEVRARL